MSNASKNLSKWKGRKIRRTGNTKTGKKFLQNRSIILVNASSNGIHYRKEYGGRCYHLGEDYADENWMLVR